MLTYVDVCTLEQIQMNMSDPPIKLSNIEKRLNTYIFGIFFTLFRSGLRPHTLVA